MDMSLLNSINLALMIVIGFMCLLLVIISIARKLPSKRSSGKENSFSRKMIVLIIFSILLILILTILFTGYFVSAKEKENLQDKQEIEKSLEESLHMVNSLRSQKITSEEELERLQRELETALEKLRKKKTKTKIVYVTNGGY